MLYLEMTTVFDVTVKYQDWQFGVGKIFSMYYITFKVSIWILLEVNICLCPHAHLSCILLLDA